MVNSPINGSDHILHLQFCPNFCPKIEPGYPMSMSFLRSMIWGEFFFDFVYLSVVVNHPILKCLFWIDLQRGCLFSVLILENKHPLMNYFYRLSNVIVLFSFTFSTKNTIDNSNCITVYLYLYLICILVVVLTLKFFRFL